MSDVPNPGTTGEMIDEMVEPVWRRVRGWLLRKWCELWVPTPPPSSSPSATHPERGILVIGPGGTGKTTFAKLVSGDMTPWVFGKAWKYEESVSEEVFSLHAEPSVEIVVPAGQESRRAAAWADVVPDIAAGRYSGVVLTTAFGHHTFTGLGYKDHKLYDGNKQQFLADYAEAKRHDECETLEFLLPALETVREKLWLITLVTKQDLWWSQKAEMERFYTTGDWDEGVTRLSATLGARRFRHELCPVSLTMGNLRDPDGEMLFPTTSGYDVAMQEQSLAHLCRVLDGLRQWEDEK